jgi:hypothetical protein
VSEPLLNESKVDFGFEQRLGVVVLTNSAGGADDIGFHLIGPALSERRAALRSSRFRPLINP